MQTLATVLKAPKQIGLAALSLTDPGPEDLVVEIQHSGVSTGTEKLFWTGQMPPFPGMGYPLVPGYEAAGEIVEAGALTGFKPGEKVFVPGANCFVGAHGLFGGSARHLVTQASRVARLDPAMGAEGALFALAATARHAVAGLNGSMPDLIVGHGTLGRLLARLTLAAGARPPTVWEINPERRSSAAGYAVLDPAEDPRRDYDTIFDASGQAALLNDLIGRIRRGGEIVLAGFYPEPLSFAFPPAFMKEARLRIAAEWTAQDLVATRTLIESGALSLSGLITHERPAKEAVTAYPQAFNDPACLKMILNWKDAA